MYIVAGHISHNAIPIDNNIINNIKQLFPYKSVTPINFSFFKAIVFSQKDKLNHTDFYQETSDYLLFVFCSIHNKKHIESIAEINNTEAYCHEKLFLKAYLKIGNKLFEQCYGKWIFIRIHKQTLQIEIYRDHLGMYSLYYYHDKQSVYFSTHVSILRQYKNINLEINKFQLASLLLGFHGVSEETSFLHIYKVPPSSQVTINEKCTEIKPYWQLKISKIKYSKSEDYYEQFIYLLNQYFDEVLQSDEIISTTLSSGLDSSFITAFLANKINPKSIYAITSIPLRNYIEKPNKRRYGNELPLAKTIANKYSNIVHITDDASDMDLISALKQSLNIHGYPLRNALNQHWIISLLKKLNHYNVNKLFIAQMGNLTISWPFYDLNQPFYKKIYQFLLYKTKLSSVNFINKHKYLFNPAFLKKYDVLSYFNQVNYSPSFQNFSLDKKRKYFFNQYLLQGYSTWNEKGIFFGIDVLDPYADPRILEFCFSLPNYLFTKNRENRLFVKNTGKHLLPSEVINNNKKAIQAADINLRIHRELNIILELLKRLKHNEVVNEIFDLKHFEQNLFLKDVKNQVFLRLLLIILFIDSVTTNKYNSYK